MPSSPNIIKINTTRWRTRCPIIWWHVFSQSRKSWSLSAHYTNKIPFILWSVVSSLQHFFDFGLKVFVCQHILYNKKTFFFFRKLSSNFCAILWCLENSWSEQSFSFLVFSSLVVQELWAQTHNKASGPGRRSNDQSDPIYLHLESGSATPQQRNLPFGWVTVVLYTWVF